MLARPNVASKEWIFRQYDHEVQGGSVVKPLVGVNQDVPSDAAVVRPVLDSLRGLAITQAINPAYGRIDAYPMTAVTIDEAVRRLIAVGADPDHIGGIDNFCWPEVRFDPERNPDGKLKAAHLVRSCLALKAGCLAYGIPLLSGKDSMYIDGNLEGAFGERHRVSGLPSLQFTAISVVRDVRQCVTMMPKRPGDIVYILGITRDELGGSEYYDMFGETGCHVPAIEPHAVFPMYKALAEAIRKGWVASAHAIHRGGLGVHLALMAIGGELGLEVELARVPCAADGGEVVLRNDVLLYSESAGRLLVTVPRGSTAAFDRLMEAYPCAPIGRVTETPRLMVRGVRERGLLDLPIASMRAAWQQPFGHLL